MFKEKGDASFDKMGDLNTLIGKGALFEGNLTVQHSLRIDGKLKGNIQSTDSIIIGKEGEVEGEVHVKNAIIGGKVKGKVIATGKVTLESTAEFTGELRAAKLVIDEGAIFDGTSQMREKPASRFGKEAKEVKEAKEEIQPVSPGSK
ncbi:MAG TPA: polymer-forming cytoskeletal protein [Bacteroidetes bacterium]|nr:polymer-forming cytoskeletal protein [Bacteroidota bacterium]